MTIRPTLTAQRGVSLSGLIFILIILGMLGMLTMKLVPTYTEYLSIKKAIASAKAAGASPVEIRKSFDKQQETGYFDAVQSKDLAIVSNGRGGFDVGFEYQKNIPLAGPVSLLIDYEASTTGKPVKMPISK